VPELIDALTQELGEEQRPAIVCGGIIPPEDVEELCHAGVAAVYGPGTSIRDAADALLDIIINNS
jgi:methylmalonyl-CoA mutase